MNTFDKIIYASLRESVLTLAKDDLDPVVFQPNVEGTPVLRETIRIQILKDIDEIRKILPVVNFYIIGSILTKNYDVKTDIDVSVQVDAQQVDSIATADVMHLLANLNGRMAGETAHPINYYVVLEDFDDTKVDAAYDVINDKWLKLPKAYEPDIEKWSLKFQETLKSIDITTGEIRRDLMDIEEIRGMHTTKIKKLKILMKQKLQHLEELLKQLVSVHRDTKMLRKMAFDRFLTPHEIQEYGTRNMLPENILYKLLEKYYYIKFIKKIESILDERDELELTDVPQIKKVMGDLWKASPNT